MRSPDRIGPTYVGRNLLNGKIEVQRGPLKYRYWANPMANFFARLVSRKPKPREGKPGYTNRKPALRVSYDVEGNALVLAGMLNLNHWHKSSFDAEEGQNEHGMHGGIALKRVVEEANRIAWKAGLRRVETGNTALIPINKRDMLPFGLKEMPIKRDGIFTQFGADVISPDEWARLYGRRK